MCGSAGNAKKIDGLRQALNVSCDFFTFELLPYFQMTDHLFELPPTFRLYHHKAIFPATFFGGPLVAGYLAAENFKLLDKPEKATSAWLISLAVTVMIFGTIVLIPALEKLPRFVIPAAYSFGAQALILKYQGHA